LALATNLDGSLPVSGVGGSHGDDGRPTHDLVQGGSRVRQLVHVVEGGKSVSADDGVELLLDLPLDVGIVQHVDDGPQQRRLERLDAGGEEIENDLLELGFGVEPVEDVLVVDAVLVLATLGGVHLEKVGVHQVAGVFGVQGLAVLGDDAADELEHFFAVGPELLASVGDARQVFQEGQEDHGAGEGEEPEPFVKELHESLELRVLVVEPLGHDHGADDVGDGAVDERGGVDGDAVVFAVEDVEKVKNFRLN